MGVLISRLLADLVLLYHVRYLETRRPPAFDYSHYLDN